MNNDTICKTCSFFRTNKEEQIYTVTTEPRTTKLNNEVLKHSCYQPRNCHNEIKVEVLPACQSFEFKLKPIAIRVLTIRTVLDIFIFCISSLTMYNCLCSKYTNYANLLKYFYNNDNVLQLNIFIIYKFGSTFSCLLNRPDV